MCPRMEAIASRISCRCGVMRSPCCLSALRSSSAVGTFCRARKVARMAARPVGLTGPATVASAPGRVNLIGEHTDYNGGFVLPTAIPQRTRATLTPRTDRTVVASSDNAPTNASFELGREARRGDWVDYVQGLTWALAQLAVPLERGFDLHLSSDVPLGAGLSSSAALEVAVLRAIRAAFDLATLDDVRIAQLGQLAENEFVGARC